MTDPVKANRSDYPAEKERLFLGFIPPAIGSVIGSIFVALFSIVAVVKSFDSWNGNSSPRGDVVQWAIAFNNGRSWPLPKYKVAEFIAELRTKAESGDVAAARELGKICLTGREVPIDYTQALKWLQIAANRGDSEAEYALGVIYENGQGVPKDEVAASNWYKKSAALGQSDAQAALKRLNGR